MNILTELKGPCNATVRSQIHSQELVSNNNNNYNTLNFTDLSSRVKQRKTYVSCTKKETNTYANSPS